MDSPKALRAPTDEPRSHAPEDWYSNTGMALIWIDAILFVPAIFGVMFLPPLARLLVVSICVGLAATYGILYSWARLHPTSASAHLLELLHIAPRRRVTR